VLQSVARAGTAITAYTRFGYPRDLPKKLWKFGNLDIPGEDVIDGIVYRRMATPNEGRTHIPVDRYMQRYAEELEQIVLRERPEIIHAASAFLVGIPAVTVARRLGIPSVYEVRGLWEVTHVSRDPNWEETGQHAAYVRLETEAAMAADAVLTLTGALKQELIRRGVPEAKITVVPNSVDTERFVPVERDEELARRLGVDGTPIVGYIGSFVDYEGLDELLDAAAIVLDRGTDFRLLLVGDGVEFPRLRALVRDLDLDDQVIMPGRVPFEDVHRYYSLVDVVAFPRKPWPVTEMVSPMKPFEAMAMEKALLVSSVDALTEIVADGETGIVFEKGNIDSLADALERLVQNAALRERLGKNARAWVVNNRRWDQAGATIQHVYRTVRRPIPAGADLER
jgi:glycosyltransferase involved in cell wall biosynthesis